MLFIWENNHGDRSVNRFADTARSHKSYTTGQSEAGARMNNEEFDETEGADWQLEGEAMFHVRLSIWPPPPGSKQVVKARFTLGYESGEQENI